jgi:CheY-like chemotaxis protein
MTPVLIADDDADTRETLQQILEDAGYPTLIAADGEQALAILRSTPTPLIALLDISLPRLDGLSILRNVAQGGIGRGQQAYILCTGHNPAVYAPFASLLAELRVAVLSKPFDIDDLLATLNRAEKSLSYNR